MPNRKQFHEYIQVKNLREGAWIDGKLRSIFFDLRVGPFSFFGCNFTSDYRSLHLNAKKVTMKPAFVAMVRKKVKAAVKQLRLDKAAQTRDTNEVVDE